MIKLLKEDFGMANVNLFKNGFFIGDYSSDKVFSVFKYMNCRNLLKDKQLIIRTNMYNDFVE